MLRGGGGGGKDPLYFSLYEAYSQKEGDQNYREEVRKKNVRTTLS